MKRTPIVLALALMGASTVARADEDEDPSKHRLSIILQGNYYGARDDQMSFWRADAATGISFDILPALTVHTLVHVGKTSLSFNGPLTEDFRVSSELSSPADVSIESGLSLKLLRRGPFTLTTFGEFEATPVRTEFQMSRAAIRTEQGDFDISSYGKEHTKFYYSWYRLAAGVGFNLTFGRFTPRLLVGYERVSASVDAHIDDDGKKLLTELGYDGNRVEERYDLTSNLVTISPGLEIKLPMRFAIDVQGTIAPTNGALYYAATLGLSWRP